MTVAMRKKPGKTKIEDQIDENLRRIYDDIVKEEVPDRFKLLLDQLRQKSGDDGGTS